MPLHLIYPGNVYMNKVDFQMYVKNFSIIFVKVLHSIRESGTGVVGTEHGEQNDT